MRTSSLLDNLLYLPRGVLGSINCNEHILGMIYYFNVIIGATTIIVIVINY